MITFHGYPQHPDAYPERPWWRLDRSPIDGWEVSPRWAREGAPYVQAVLEFGASHPPADVLADIDRTDHYSPMPAPRPMCGQVWVWPHASGGERQAMVTSVRPGSWDGGKVTGLLVEMFGVSSYYVSLDPETGATNWPMLYAVLVAGPGAPWTPFGEESKPG